MSAMEKMAKNILESMIPPEIMALMTEENITKAKAVMIAFIQQQESIYNHTMEISSTVATNQNMLEEVLEYVRSQRDSVSGGKRVRNSPSKSAGPDNGDATSN